jgi:hypothetical protein
LRDYFNISFGFFSSFVSPLLIWEVIILHIQEGRVKKKKRNRN